VIHSFDDDLGNRDVAYFQIRRQLGSLDSAVTSKRFKAFHISLHSPPSLSPFIMTSVLKLEYLEL
jgi:hypothetical protein